MVETNFFVLLRAKWFRKKKQRPVFSSSLLHIFLCYSVGLKKTALLKKKIRDLFFFKNHCVVCFIYFSGSAEIGGISLKQIQTFTPKSPKRVDAALWAKDIWDENTCSEV